MAKSRSVLKQDIDGINAQLSEEQRVQYLDSASAKDLTAVLATVTALLESEPEQETETPDEVAGNVPDNAESNSDDEVVAEDETIVPDEADDVELKDESGVEMKQCAGNHSMYPKTVHNFPTKWGGRYSREHLISKRLLAK